MARGFDYADIRLWEADEWRDRQSPLLPIIERLTARARQLHSSYSGASGEVDRKTNALVVPELIERWKARGMDFRCAGMGMAGWTALVPEGAPPETPVLLVPLAADMGDSLWAMALLEEFEEYCALAAERRFALLWVVWQGPGGRGVYADILLELAALCRLSLGRVLLDLTPLGDAPGLPATELLGGLNVVDVTGCWLPRVAHQFIVGNLNRGNPEFDFERLIHSPLGRAMAAGMRFERDYEGAADPRLHEYLAGRGLRLDINETAGERWLMLSPARENGPLPLLICMKEVRPSGEFQALTALQFYSEFLDIAANGECRLLFFALESPEDNELLCDILDEAAGRYAIDRTRVYITGQSHNGYLALEFARRHPELIAAAATLNDRHGISSPAYSVDNVRVTDEMLESFRRFSLPLINICGEIENVFPHTEPGTEAFENAIDAFRRRLRAFRCPDRSREEIISALSSPDKATRKNGLPADRTELGWSMGFEMYISDIQNEDGRWQLRFITLENLPHMISPQMAQPVWAFLRRFARRPGTLETVELDRMEGATL